MDTNWKNDPRLKAMSKEKLNLLTEFAERIEHTNKNNLMEAFMSINMEARQKGIQFNDKETALLVTILSSGMAPAEKKKAGYAENDVKKNWQGRADTAPLPSSKTCTIPKSSETFHISAITILVCPVADCTSSFALASGRRIQPAEPLSADAVKQWRKISRPLTLAPQSSLVVQRKGIVNNTAERLPPGSSAEFHVLGVVDVLTSLL